MGLSPLTTLRTDSSTNGDHANVFDIVMNKYLVFMENNTFMK